MVNQGDGSASRPSSWPPVVRSGGASGHDRDRNKRAAPSGPDAYWRRNQEMSTEYETLSLKINPPRVVVDNTTQPDATLVKVDSANRHGCLLEVVQLLTDLDLCISKAYISSDGGWFVDVFHVMDQLGNKVTDPHTIDFIQQVLGAKRDVSVQEVKTCLGRAVTVQSAATYTAIELTGPDRPGMLSRICAVLAEMECNVEAAEVWTHNRRAACVVYMTDGATGGAVAGSKIEKLTERLQDLMKLDDGRTTTKTDCWSGLSTTERRLHQMMHADHDYEPLDSPGRSTNSTKRPMVTVRNCTETSYSIVTIQCPDRPKLLFDTVCTLTDMQYVVFHGSVICEDDIATQEFYIRHLDGCTLDSEAERQRVVKCLEAAIERRVPMGLRLELCTGDRVGLLSDVTRIFRDNGLSVTGADVATRDQKAVNVFYVTNASGEPVDMAVVEAMRQEIGQTVLQVKEAPKFAPSPPRESPPDRNQFSLAHLIRSQSQRFMYSLGLTTAS